LRDSIYVEKSTGGVIKVNGKFNALTINNVQNVGIVFDTAIATVEVINSKKVQLQCVGQAPTIVVDKSNQITIYASEASKETTKIITASSTAVNYVVPVGDDTKEYNLPEQVLHLLKGGKMTSEVNTDSVGV